MRFYIPQTYQDTKLVFNQTCQIISEQCLVFKLDCLLGCLIKLPIHLLPQYKDESHQTRFQMRNRLIGLCILGWVLGMYSLTIFAVKQEVLLDADFEKKISK